MNNTIVNETAFRKQEIVKSKSIRSNAPHKKIKIYYLIPGIILFLIWVIGNIMTEEEKQRLFGEDDISGWLISSLGIFIIGLIIGLLNKK